MSEQRSAQESARGVGMALLALAGLLAAAFLIVPVAAYLVGKRFVGPYGGTGGLSDYLGRLYAGAAAGEWPALALLAAPLLIAGIWLGVIWLSRRLGGSE